jgi:S1-C subfamily serine protease
VDLLDLFIILAALGYAVGGYRNGAVVGLFSLAGFLGGAVAGAQLGRPLATRIAHGQGQVVVALVCVLVFALVGQLALVYVARLVRSRITWRSVQAVDSGIGALLGIVSVLLVAWMVAVPLASSPYPNLASQARRSSIVASVNDAVPNDLRNVYSSLRNFIDRSGFPQVFDALSPTHIVSVDPPSGALATAAGVTADEPSVLKVYGRALSCSRAIEGSGFVFAPGKLLTNAHVVAGTDQVQVVLPSGARTSARVVLYDPERDVAVLDAPGVKPTQSPPLAFAAVPASTDASAIVLGYPEDHGFTVAPARIRDQEMITGHDIYGQGTVTRQIYSIRGTVISGNSGGPLITPDGSVLGIVFATALDSSDTGFVLTDSEIAPDVAAGRTATATVGTGACA